MQHVRNAQLIEVIEGDDDDDDREAQEVKDEDQVEDDRDEKEADEEEEEGEEDTTPPFGFLRQLFEWTTWDRKDQHWVFMDCNLNEFMHPFPPATRVDLVSYDPRSSTMTIIENAADPKVHDYHVVVSAIPIEPYDCGEAVEEEM